MTQEVNYLLSIVCFKYITQDMLLNWKIDESLVFAGVIYTS